MILPDAPPWLLKLNSYTNNGHLLKNSFNSLKTRPMSSPAQRDLLRFQVEELNQLGLSDGEYTTLEQEQQLLANADAILHDSHILLQLCSEAETFNLQSTLSKALHVLQDMPNKPIPLEEAEKLLGSALIEVEEAGREIQHHLDSFELDPERLQQVEETTQRYLPAGT